MFNELEALAARWEQPHQSYSGITNREHARELRELIEKHDGEKGTCYHGVCLEEILHQE
jgi:hypothetical protein